MLAKKSFKGFLFLSLAVFLNGCSSAQSEKDLLAEAQLCMDKATAPTAASCLTKIQSLTSQKAYALRCAGGFITAGVTSPQNLGDAFSALSDPTQGTATLMAKLKFASVTDASSTADACNSSGQGGLALIGAMAKTATILVSTGLSNCVNANSSASTCANDLKNLMTTLATSSSNNDKETVLAVAQSIQSVYTSTCAGAANTNSEICSDIDGAAAQGGIDLTTANNTQLLTFGQNLMGVWKNQ